MNRIQAIRNLVDIQIAFPKGFLAYGSALGAHREQDIISHDLDTDFGVFSSDFSFRTISELIKDGFIIGSIFGMRDYGMEVSLSRGGVKTDIMIIYEDEDKFWSSLWDNGGRNGMSDEIRHEYPKEVFAEKRLARIGSYTFNYYGEKYIKAVYGEDWLIPKKEWNWRTDHKCLKKLR